MNDMPLFTILCASRNMHPYISQCIGSVIDQDYQNWEMVVIDDASDDGTYDIAKSVASSYSNIKVFRNDARLHCGMNYSKILSMANGKYCGVLDGDDKLVPNAISTIVKLYENNPKIDFIWTQHRWCNGRMDRFKPGICRPPMRGTIYDSEGDKLKHVYSHWRTFKTEMRDRGQLFRKLKCTVDKDLGYTLEELGRGAFYKEPLYLYRYHRDNMSHHSSQKAVWREVRKYHRNKHRFKSIIL